jgi:endonuclease YncB( thermonuclease family)
MLAPKPLTRIVKATVLGAARLLVDHGLDTFIERDVRLTEGVMPPDGTVVLFQCEKTSRKITAGKIVASTGPLYRYPAKTARCVDGDTLWFDAELWEGSRRRIVVRVNGCNTPESHGEKACPEGIAAAAFTASLLPVGAPVVIATRKVTTRLVGHGEKVEVHGRYLADVVLPDGSTLTSTLISKGHAIEYHGEYKIS